MSSPFSASYDEARARFRAATATHPHGALEVVDGLTIDWAITGDPDARDVLVFSSGLHGVEGYAGSAAQLALLAQPPAATVLWLHALNPWGMANLRRVNEQNVDLNRNFLPPGQAYAREDAAYTEVDALLNPPTPPGFELFWLRAGWLVATKGYQALKNTIVGGQYQNPKGLFFGGSTLQAGPAALLPFVEATLAGRRKVVHVDLHTGLGPFAGRTLLLEGETTPEQVERVRAAFGPAVKAWDAANTDAYEIRGGMLREIQRRLPGVRFDGMTCEFGTYANLKVLAALRAENRATHWGAATPADPARRALLEAFVPDHPAWRAAVVQHAHALAEAGLKLLGA